LKSQEFISKWFPEAGEPTYNVLQSLPIGSIHPEGFVEGGTSIMNHLILRMTRKVFQHQPNAEEHWRQFKASAPKSDDVSEFLVDHQFHIPLHDALLNGLPIDLSAPSIKKKTRDTSIIHAKDTVLRKNNSNNQIAVNVLAGLKGNPKSRGRRKTRTPAEDDETLNDDINIKDSQKAPTKRKSTARLVKPRQRKKHSSSEDEVSSEHDDEKYIGRRCTVPVRNNDGTEDVWRGRVLSFDSKARYYKVRYDDNSEEEFSENEILQIVDDSADDNN
jgi:hypothetical protein